MLCCCAPQEPVETVTVPAEAAHATEKVAPYEPPEVQPAPDVEPAKEPDPVVEEPQEPEPVKEEPVKKEPEGPPSCLHFSITFDVNGEEVTKYVTRKPLGMGFKHEKGAPVNKVGPGSHAEELGIQLEWKIKALNVNATAGKDVATFKKEVMDLVKALPEK